MPRRKGSRPGGAGRCGLGRAWTWGSESRRHKSSAGNTPGMCGWWGRGQGTCGDSDTDGESGPQGGVPHTQRQDSSLSGRPRQRRPGPGSHTGQTCFSPQPGRPQPPPAGPVLPSAAPAGVTDGRPFLRPCREPHTRPTRNSAVGWPVPGSGVTAAAAVSAVTVPVGCCIGQGRVTGPSRRLLVGGSLL